jgi:phosphoglycerate dehydrogenase-like enzyme
MQRVAGPVMAEHVIAMMLAFARGLQFFIPEREAGRWTEEPPSSVRMVTIEGKNVLVVGLGGIGTEVARRAHALGMRVTATRASGREGPEFVSYVGLPDELHKLAADADFIVNTTPLTPQTTGIFNASFFAAAKPGAYFINVGRGGSVVQADLVAALESGRIAGAGLDVTEPEPLPSTSPLWKMQNVITTPHVSADSDRVRCEWRSSREPASLRRRRTHAVGGRPRQGLLIAAGTTQPAQLAAQLLDRLLQSFDPGFEATG